MKEETKNNQPPAEPTILSQHLGYLQEDKIRYALMLWEMSELWLLNNEGASAEKIDNFRSDTTTLRKIIANC